MTRERFERDGIVFPLPVLTDDEIARYRAELESLQHRSGRTKRLDMTHLYFDWAWELALHPAVVDAVETILGSELVVWGSLIFTKPPHDDGFVAWHQDGAYADFLGPAKAASAWIALTDSTPASGCMRVVPGSHRHRHDHIVTRAENNLLSRGHEIAVDVDERDAIDVVLHAGEMSLHHVDIIHGSTPNRAAHPRTGFIVRYATADMAAANAPLLRARGARELALPMMESAPGDRLGAYLERG
jgi:ectoine hydroxylase-related dioxygenase (phytanoyl-CoA dioxygenase family)